MIHLTLSNTLCYLEGTSYRFKHQVVVLVSVLYGDISVSSGCVYNGKRGEFLQSIEREFLRWHELEPRGTIETSSYLCAAPQTSPARNRSSDHFRTFGVTGNSHFHPVNSGYRNTKAALMKSAFLGASNKTMFVEPSRANGSISQQTAIPNTDFDL